MSIFGFLAILCVVILAGYVIFLQERSRRELALLLASRNPTEIHLLKAQKEKKLTPKPADQQPLIDDEFEAMMAEKRWARDQALLEEYAEGV